MFTDLFRRLRALIRPGLVERELRDELDFHLQQDVDRLRRAGLAPDEAARRARLELGGLDQVREECRDARGISGLDRLRKDVRFALRVLSSAKAFSATVAGTLALGIGASATAFSVLDGMLLKPLPYAHADRLVQLGTTFGPVTVSAMSAPDLLDITSRARMLDAAGAARARTVDLTGSGSPERVAAAVVSASFFEVLGAGPVAGRLFDAADDARGAPHAAVISHRFWRRHFGGGDDVIGRLVTLDGTPQPIVGILPRGFRGPEALSLSETDLWLPLGPTRPAAEDRDDAVWSAIARLTAGRSVAQVAAELEAIGEAIGRDAGGGRRRFWVAGLRDQTIGETGREIWLLFAAVSVLLIVACANVAGLCVVRAIGRSREMAIRMAMGASRRRLARQLLAESALLASVGGAIGVGLAAAGIAAFRALAPADSPRLSDVALDGRVLGFSLIVTAASTLAFGLAPAIDAGRHELVAVLRNTAAAISATRGRARLRSGLAVIQIALAVVLLVGSALLVHSLVRLGRVDPGFNARDLVWLDLVLPERYADAAGRLQLLSGVLSELRGGPDVDRVGAIVGRPLGGGNAVASVQPEQRLPAGDAPAPRVPFHVVTPGYFAAMEIPFVDGRDVREDDRIGSPRVAVVSRSFAERFWPGERAVGKRFWMGRIAADAPLTEVVGVVADVRQYGLARAAEPIVYRPIAQAPVPRAAFSLLIRHRGAAVIGVADRVREVIWRHDAALPLDRMGTMDGAVRASIGEPRFRALASSIFAAIAASVAGVGLYATLAWIVRARRRELGIRMALGASHAEIRGLLLRRGWRLTLAGLTIGTAGALLASRLLESMVFGITTVDVPTFATALAAMAFVAAIACWMPMRRAAAVDPVDTLRAE